MNYRDFNNRYGEIRGAIYKLSAETDRLYLELSTLRSFLPKVVTKNDIVFEIVANSSGENIDFNIIAYGSCRDILAIQSRFRELIDDWRRGVSPPPTEHQILSIIS